MYAQKAIFKQVCNYNYFSPTILSLCFENYEMIKIINAQIYATVGLW